MLDGLFGARAPLNLAPATKKICITGTTPSRMQAPFDDPSWNPPNGEIWTIGPGGHNVTKWHALFEIHGPTTWPIEFAPYLECLKTTQAPKRVFTTTAVPEWPTNVVLPKERYYEKYGKVWFSSSIAWCIVQAVEEGATDVGLYGIDLEAGEEYIAQWIGCRHFIDMFTAQGVTFHMPDGCGLMRDPSPYPDRWETHTALTIQKKLEQVRGQKGPLLQKHESLSIEIRHKEGWKAAIEGKMTADDLPKIEEAMRHLSAELGQVAATINTLNGAEDVLTFLRSRTMIGNPGE